MAVGKALSPFDVHVDVVARRPRPTGQPTAGVKGVALTLLWELVAGHIPLLAP